MVTALLEKQDAKKPEAAESDTGAVPYHWTVEAFSKASDAGVFGHSKRLELVQGRIIEIMGQGPRHATLASEIADMLRDAAKKQFAIREEKPFRIDFDGEPIPDIMVLSGRQADYDDHQPGPEDVRLLVEVSVTTNEYDLGEKAMLYAQSGIADYWVVMVKENTIVRHRQPSPQGYGEVMRLTGENSLSPLAMPEIVWNVAALLGKE